MAHDVGRPGAEPDLHVAVGGQRVEQRQRAALQRDDVTEEVNSSSTAMPCRRA
jgi:hypothetical protein